MRRGRKYRIDLLTKMKIEIIIENVEKIVNTIINEAQNGKYRRWEGIHYI